MSPTQHARLSLTIGLRDAGLTCAASALWYLSKPTKTP